MIAHIYVWLYMGLQIHNAVAFKWWWISAGHKHVVPDSKVVRSGGRKRLFTSPVEELALEHGAALHR